MASTPPTRCPELPLPVDLSPGYPRWFAENACVKWTGRLREVVVGGVVVADFDEADHARRNVELVTLAKNERVSLGALAEALGVSLEGSRLLRRQARLQGTQSVAHTLRRGRQSQVTTAQRKRVMALFDEGQQVQQVSRAVGKLSQRTVQRLRGEWLAARRIVVETAAPPTATPAPPVIAVEWAEMQIALKFSQAPGAALVDTSPPDAASETQSVISVSEELGDATETRSRVALAIEALPADESPGAAASSDEPVSDDLVGNEPVGSEPVGSEPVGSEPVSEEVTGQELAGEGPATEAMQETIDDSRGNGATDLRSARGVQHLGTWLMLATLHQWGIYNRLLGLVAPAMRDALRIALDAFIAALCLGERCAEGVRRLQTPTAGALLRSRWAPSASWTRGVLDQAAGWAAVEALPMVMAAHYIARVESESKADPNAIFYIDNHLRPYTGGRVIRKGWRMQDKRARPGATDCYVHDEDGRPIYRITATDNPSLTTLLTPLARLLTKLCGDSVHPVVCFDRGGAFAEQMAELRDASIDFVTYERGPYPLLAAGKFDQTITIDGEVLRWTEARINLGKKRGRLRRIMLLTADGKQVNLLAAGTLPAPYLIEAMAGRWVQENGFKHAVERWGINQLDSRKTEAYPPGTVIPNPARRRLDRASRAQSDREGRARRELARAEPGSAAHASATEELADALEEQDRILALRPTTPKHAPLSDTELAGKLVRHLQGYKTILDTLRIGCMNVEADLAARLAQYLPRPAEAKKALANLLAAPGHLRVTNDRVHILLMPAGTPQERAAFAALLRIVNSHRLAMPGDPKRRPMVMRVQE